ncbi:MAG: hypothetical protein E6J28_00745, partial [Chloroflexi bacterium]
MSIYGSMCLGTPCGGDCSSAAANSGFGDGIGLTFTACALLTFTTASGTKQIVDPADLTGNTKLSIPSGFTLAISGEVHILGLISATGSLKIAINSSQFTIAFDVSLSLGPLSVQATGFAGIYFDDNPGLVLRLAISVNFNVFDIIKIVGQGEIRMNTTAITRNANGLNIGGHSFLLHISGTISILDVIRLQTTIEFVVGGGPHTVTVDNSPYTVPLGEGDWLFFFSASANFFGIGLAATGWVDSFGEYDMSLNGGITIGSSSFGLSGSIHFRTYLHIERPIINYHFLLSFGGSVSVRAFGISLAGCSISGSLHADGPGGEIPLILSVHISISFLFFSINADASFNIGTIKLPKPVYLAGDAGGGAADGQATWHGGGATLWLNTGARSNAHTGYPGSGVSSGGGQWTIEHVGGTAGHENVQVTAFGHQQVFKNVGAIVAHGGTADSFIVAKGVTSHTTVQLAGGNASLVYDGRGGADLTGGSGTDYIEAGPDAAGTITFTGGSGTMYMVNHSTADNVTMTGGSGSATIIGGTGKNGALTGGSGKTVITDNGVNDQIYGGSGDIAVTIHMPSAANQPSFRGLSGPRNVLSITGTPNGDEMLIKKSTTLSNGVEIDHIIRNAQNNIVDLGVVGATNVTELILNSGAGANTITVADLSGSTVQQLSLDAGQNVVDTGQTQLVSDPNNPGVQVQQPVILTGGHRGKSAITIYGALNTGETFTLSGTNPNSGVQIVRSVGGWNEQIFVKHTLPAQGDSLTIIGQGGNDTFDAGALGVSSTNPNAAPVKLLGALSMTGGTGDNRFIGSPFDETIDCGLGNCTVTGGGGLDTFFSSDPASDSTGPGKKLCTPDKLFHSDCYTNTLIETRDADMGLYNDTLVIGHAMDNTGTIPYATDAGLPLKEEDMARALTNHIALPQPGYGNRWAVGATVENLKGIFQMARINGGDSNTTLVVNSVDGKIYVGGVPHSVQAFNGHAVLNAGSTILNPNIDRPDHYVITIGPGSTAQIDVADSRGGSGGSADVVVFGSQQADNITLNAAGTGSFAVGFVQTTGTSNMNITYQGVQTMELFTLGGDDFVLSQDTAVLTRVGFGGGDDHLVVGTVPLIPDPGNRTLEFPNGVPVADTAHMTNGTTAPLFATGGSGTDVFEVNHNRGKVYLAGGSGDATFEIRTFLVLKENPDNPDEVTNLIKLFGGGGSNRYEYLQNGPVIIIGGTGVNTLIIDGTPIDDTFVVTNTYVAGAGRIVSFIGIQSIEIFGGGGNDQVWVLSSDAGRILTVDGGSGSVTVHVGGTPPPLVFNPPPFTYQPPSYRVALPPVQVTDDQQITLHNLAFELSIFDWIARGGISDPAGAAQRLAQGFATFVSFFLAKWGTNAHIVPNSFVATGVGYHLVWDNFFYFFFPSVVVTIDQFQWTLESSHLEQRSKVVTPPAVLVQPTPFAFIAPPSLDGSKIKGQLIVNGGSQLSGHHNAVIYENQQGTSSPGQLVQRQVQLMQKSGVDSKGKPVYVPSGRVETYVSLEGLGLGINPAGQQNVRTETYYGIEMKNVQDLQLRMANVANTLAINDSTICQNLVGQAMNCTTAGAVAAPTVEAYGGSAADTFNVYGVGAATAIHGGGGADTVTVKSTSAGLSSLLSRLTVDGNTTVFTRVTNVKDTDPDPTGLVQH